MHVESQDQRPPSLLRERPFGNAEALGGAVLAVLAHALPAVLFVLVALLATRRDFGAAPPAPEPLEVQNVVAARFVRKGRALDPNELPNRRVPIKSTAPPDDVVPTKQARRREPRPDAGPPPPNAAEDLLRRLGDRAQVFAEIAERRELEGDPDGIEEGTETEARAGDLYIGQLYALFRRGWSVPTTVSDEELASLVAVVHFDISEGAMLGGFRLARPSGNPLFDESVRQRLQLIVDTGDPLPSPPEEVADQFLGHTHTLRFRGTHAGR